MLHGTTAPEEGGYAAREPQRPEADVQRFLGFALLVTGTALIWCAVTYPIGERIEHARLKAAERRELAEQAWRRHGEAAEPVGGSGKSVAGDE
jgi:hypothetical protein